MIAASSSAARKGLHRGREIRVGVGASRDQPAEERHDPTHPDADESGGRTRSAACVDSRHTTRPPGRVTRRISAKARGTSGTLRTPQPTVTAANSPSANGSASRSPTTNRGAGGCEPRPRALGARARRASLREVEADHASEEGEHRGEIEREIAGAAAGVQDARSRGQPGLLRRRCVANGDPGRRSSGGSSRRSRDDMPLNMASMRRGSRSMGRSCAPRPPRSIAREASAPSPIPGGKRVCSKPSSGE